MIEATVEGVALRFDTDDSLFSPRRLDQGSLAMLSLVRFEPEDKVLDLGCGYGLVGVFAAKRTRPDRVHLVDNDPTAIRRAAHNLAINGVAGAVCTLSDGFRDLRETGFTKILSNPPYHADFSTPKHFIEKGFNRLTVGGALWMVTRREAWYRRKLTSIFGGARVRTQGAYFVFEAVKKSPTYASSRSGRR